MPEVELIAETRPVVGAVDVPGGTFMFDRPEDVIVFAGKTCYASFTTGEHNLNLSTVRDDRKAYIDNLLAQKHLSVLEHVSVTFRIRCSRVASHELVRHRHLSFSQESGRYVRPMKAKAWFPPLPDGLPDAVRDACELLLRAEYAARLAWEQVNYERQEAIAGLPMKVRKALTSWLRRALPQATTTTLVVSGNLRAWWEFVAKRDSDHAEIEIREIARKVRTALTERYPMVGEVEP